MTTLTLNAPVKIFVSDLTHFTKSDSSWVYNFHDSNVSGNISKIHIQGEICKTAGFNNEIFIMDDGTGKAKVLKSAQVPGDLSWVNSGLPFSNGRAVGFTLVKTDKKPGIYCSVVGTLLENGKLPQIIAHKISRIQNKILQEMWSWEVRELQALILNKVLLNLPDHLQLQE